MNRPDVGKIGSWLWHGGRLRLLKQVNTNGGKVFEAGEIVRLVRLEPYGVDSTLAVLHFASEVDLTKSFCMTGWDQSDDEKFELLS